MAHVKLDKTDRKILYYLDIDARMPVSEIAGKCRTSKTVVQYRIKKMERQGVIRGFSASLDPAKFNLSSWKVYCKFQNMTPEIEDRIIRHIERRKDLWWGIRCIGSYDMMFCILAESPYGFYHKLKAFQRQFNKYLQKVNITNHIDSLWMTRGFLVGKRGERSSGLFTQRPVSADIDKTDIMILKKLTENCRESSAKIAYSLGLTPRVVLYRINSLIRKGVITKFRLVLDINRIGYDYYKVMLSFKELKDDSRFVQFLIDHPNVIDCAKAYGPWDIEFEIEAESYKDFNRIMQEIRETFPSEIKNYESVLITEEFNPKIGFVDILAEKGPIR